MYTTVVIFRNLIYGAVAQGANLQRLCAAAGLGPADLHQTDQRVEGLARVTRLWEEILAQTGDEAFGLHHGSQFSGFQGGLVTYLIQNSPTLKDAALAFVTFQAQLSGWFTYRLTWTGVEAVYEITVDPRWVHASPHTARHATEVIMGYKQQMMKVLTGRRVVPLRVELGYASPIPAAEYERVLGCPVRLDQQQTRLFYRKEDFDLPVLAYDQSLHVLFSRLVAEKAKAMDQQLGFSEQVRQILVRDFKGQPPPVEVIAVHLNLSVRSFQRKLSEEGNTYRSVCNGLKKELAVNLLEHTDAKVTVISEVLGYAEPSAFLRAFKNWTHTTPTQLKKGGKDALLHPEP
jgi:AraC-like DNA-binding protein